MKSDLLSPHTYGVGRNTNCAAIGFVLILQTPVFKS